MNIVHKLKMEEKKDKNSALHCSEHVHNRLVQDSAIT